MIYVTKETETIRLPKYKEGSDYSVELSSHLYGSYQLEVIPSNDSYFYYEFKTNLNNLHSGEYTYAVKSNDEIVSSGLIVIK